MIECTKQRLIDAGFKMGPGLICDALSANDVYGFYQFGRDKNTLLVMKDAFGSDSYYPHRVKFSNGKELGEGELLCGDSDMADLEDVGELVELLREMDK